MIIVVAVPLNVPQELETNAPTTSLPATPVLLDWPVVNGISDCHKMMAQNLEFASVSVHRLRIHKSQNFQF